MAELVISLEEEFFFKSAQKLLLQASADNTIVYEGKLSEGINYQEKVDFTDNSRWSSNHTIKNKTN